MYKSTVFCHHTFKGARRETTQLQKLYHFQIERVLFKPLLGQRTNSDDCIHSTKYQTHFRFQWNDYFFYIV